MLGKIIPDYLALLHHESNTFEFGDVSDWITSDSYKVGKFSWLNRADAILPAQHFRRVCRNCANHVERSHSGLMQNRKPRHRGLASRFTGEVPAHVGTGGKLYSRLQNPLDQIVV